MYSNRLAYRFLSAVFISTVLFFTGCDLVSKSEYAQNPNDEVLNLNVQFTEYVQSDQPPELHLLLVTKKIYPCYNYQLQTEQVDKQSTDIRLVLEIGDVNTGGVCATAIGPARARISFDQRADINELLLINYDFTDRLNIEITSEKAVVELSEGTFTEVEETTFNRTPPYSMYARCSPQQDAPEVCDLFYNELEALEFISRFEFPEDGILPFPVAHESSSLEYRYYLYGAEDNFEELLSNFPEIADQIIEDYPESNFLIMNWKRNFYNTAHN